MTSFSFSNIAAGIIYGIWGLALIKRAKRDAKFIQLFIGIALLVYPYFIDNIFLVWGIGAILLITAYRI